MLRCILLGICAVVGAAGCENRTQPTPARVAPVEKEADVHIRAPGVKIDVERKDR